MKKLIANILLASLLMSSAVAQEVLVGVSENTALKARQRKPSPKRIREADALLLPFTDDFSKKRDYPNPRRWSDSSAFVNQDYGKFPVTVGVATLDAIDKYGNIYNDANIYPFEADRLTSNPIRLDSVFSPVEQALTPEDSVYFSFYYQPQGWANDPQPSDSLILEFLAVGENDTIYIEANPEANPPQEADTIIREGWNRIWGAGGEELKTFIGEDSTFFKRVMIPITDSAKYFNKQFRFRFRNYASLADNSLLSWQSNVDQWNIDYIELDRNRTVADTNHQDIAFVSSAPGFLKNYQAMPYWQYRANFINEMDNRFEMLISNLDENPHNASYEYNVYNPSGDIIKNYDAGSYTINPFIDEGYLNYDPFSNPEITLPFPFSTDSITFEIEHILSTDASLENQMNDTVRHTQRFYNYYAYDDGTAEAGYGLTPAGARLAYKFQLNDRDTLKGVKFFFNKTWHGTNQQYFYLTVWRDNNGKPGKIMYQSPNGILPEFGDGLNEFTTYEISDKTVAFNQQNAVFYVGWMQTSDEILNVGFDYSNDNSDKIFYNTSGEWMSSRFQGSLMIRPVFGQSQAPDPPKDDKAGKIHIHPNPASRQEAVTVKLPEGDEQNPADYEISIYDIAGKQVKHIPYRQQIGVQELSRGVYFIRLTNRVSQNTYTEKLLLTH